jgi:hypothetical protein
MRESKRKQKEKLKVGQMRERELKESSTHWTDGEGGWGSDSFRWTWKHMILIKKGIHYQQNGFELDCVSIV